MAARWATTTLVVALVTATGASDLSYPTPPNPFAKQTTGGTATPTAATSLPLSGVPPLPDGAPPALPAGSMTAPFAGEVLPGGVSDTVPTDDAMPSLPGGLLGDDPSQLQSTPPPPPSGLQSTEDDDVLGMPGVPVAKARGRGPGLRFRWRPTLCLAALSAACALTRPREPSLLSAIDAHHSEWGHLLEEETAALMRDEPVRLLDGGLATVAVHSDLIWLGLLGQWLPMLPASLEAVTPWLASAGAAQILICALSAFYLLRKVLPQRVTAAHLGVSVDNIRRGRLHTILAASLSPVGLVHWLHACLAILVCTAGLEDTASRCARRRAIC